MGRQSPALRRTRATHSPVVVDRNVRGCRYIFPSWSALLSYPPSLFKNTAPNGGTVRFTEYLLPCVLISSALTPPRLPKSSPPYIFASLLRISRQNPGRGTPTR